MDDVALGAEEVATKEFPVAFRGFSQHEVRAFLAQIAAELAASRERERLQRERLQAAEERAAARTLSDEEIEAALGHEAGKVLQAAREAANEIRARAEEQVERLVREASGKGSRAQQEAESVLARCTEEAERVAGEIQAEAERQAAEAVEQAKAEGREMVTEAQAVRERVLKDLARRRRVAHQQLEQLRAGRERLLEAYRVVRSTLDEATRELSVAEAEARAAAEMASLRVGSQPETTVDELEAEMVAARDLGLDLLVAGPGEEHSRSANGSAAVVTPSPVDESGEPSRAASHDHGPKRQEEPAVPENGAVAGARLAGPSPVDLGRSDPEPSEAPTIERGSVGLGGADLQPADLRPTGPGLAAQQVVQEDLVLEEDVVEEDVVVEENAVEEEAVEQDAAVREGDDEEVAAAEALDLDPFADPDATDVKGTDPEPVDPEPVGLEQVERERVGAALSTPAMRSDPPAPEPEPPESNGRQGEVEGLFARLRAEREAKVARAEVVLAQPVAPAATAAPMANGATPAPAPAPASPSSGTGSAVADDDTLQVRDAEVEVVERSLVKALKRALADEQNEVLDILRRSRGPATLADLLPGASDHTARYLAVAAPELRDAVARGAGGDGHRGAADPQLPSIDDLAVGLAAEVADDLRSRLQRALEAADGDETTLADGISAAYREWKTARAEPLARHHVVAAHGRGRFAVAPEGPLRWVVDEEEGPCPDCHDNSLAGATPKGSPFPTGQLHPPAHVGCRCTIVAHSR